MKEAQNVQERVEIASNYFSHPGSTKLYTTMKEHWNEPGLKDAIEKNRKNCAICQRNSLGKAVVPKTQDLGQLPTMTPFEDIGSDIFGPFELPVRNRKYWIITITDRCTRWTQIRTTTKIDTTGIINALKIWITEHGVPKTFLHDQGTQYVAKETQDFLTSLNIRDVKTSPYNPTGNGISERINQEIRFVITSNRYDGIRAAAPAIEKRLNQMRHSFIECTPFELVHGYHPLDPDKKSVDKQLILEKIKRKVFSKENLSRTIPKEKTPTVGDSVYYRNTAQGDKLKDHWLGPIQLWM